jgi:hypothetical protein
MLLTGCATAPAPMPEVLVACDIDLSPLTQCRYPIDLPSQPVEAIAALFVALSLCVEAVSLVEQPKARE